MSAKTDKRLVVRVPIFCDERGHGRLTAWQDATGRVRVRPCLTCRMQTGSAVAAAWRDKIKKALDG